MLNKEELSKNIQTLRKRAGLNQAELAERVGVNFVTISRWETGVDTPKTLKIKKLASALNVTEAELLNGSDKQEFEVKILLGVKSVAGVGGVEVADNTFFYGIQDDKPQIHLAGKINIGTPEERENALTKLIAKFHEACWMFDHRGEAAPAD